MKMYSGAAGAVVIVGVGLACILGIALSIFSIIFLLTTNSPVCNNAIISSNFLLPLVPYPATIMEQPRGSTCLSHFFIILLFLFLA